MLRQLKIISRKIQIPAICNLCSQYHYSSFSICEFCRSSLIPIGSKCEICALPIPMGDTMTCGKCLKKRPIFDKIFVNYTYEEPLRTILHEFKYKEGLYLSSFLADLMIQNFVNDLTDSECLIPVPLHYAKLKTRGFNQAALLSRNLAKFLKIPAELNYCQKIYNTKSQAGLTLKERHKNLKNAFQLTKPINYKKIILIDDLITSGSTVNELAKLFKQNGVQKVFVWCVARTC